MIPLPSLLLCKILILCAILKISLVVWKWTVFQGLFLVNPFLYLTNLSKKYCFKVCYMFEDLYNYHYGASTIWTKIFMMVAHFGFDLCVVLQLEGGEIDGLFTHWFDVRQWWPTPVGIKNSNNLSLMINHGSKFWE